MLNKDYSFDTKAKLSSSFQGVPFTFLATQKKADQAPFYEVTHSRTINDVKAEVQVLGNGVVMLTGTTTKHIPDTSFKVKTDLGSANVDLEYTGVSDTLLTCAAKGLTLSGVGLLTASAVRSLGEVAGGPLTVGVDAAYATSGDGLAKFDLAASYAHGGYTLACNLADKGDSVKLGCMTSAYGGTVASEASMKMSKGTFLAVGGYATTLPSGEKFKAKLDSNGTASCSIGVSQGPTSITFSSSMDSSFGPPKVGVNFVRK